MRSQIFRPASAPPPDDVGTESSRDALAPNSPFQETPRAPSSYEALHGARNTPRIPFRAGLARRPGELIAEILGDCVGGSCPRPPGGDDTSRAGHQVSM